MTTTPRHLPKTHRQRVKGPAFPGTGKEGRMLHSRSQIELLANFPKLYCELEDIKEWIFHGIFAVPHTIDWDSGDLAEDRHILEERTIASFQDFGVKLGRVSNSHSLTMPVRLHRSIAL
jgi:hypothetical protein